MEETKFKDDFSLPIELSVPDDEMRSCIIYGLPKCGKTTALSLLPNCLIIDTEDGADKISGLVKKVPEGIGPVTKMQWLEKLADKLIESGKPYDFVAIDTMSEVNDWAEWSGTFRYQNTTLGKSFNREKDGFGNPIKGGEFLKPDDPDYQSVHTIPDGYGYRWSREDTLRVFEKYR